MGSIVFPGLQRMIAGISLALLMSACSLGGKEREADTLDGVRFQRLEAAESAQALDAWVTASVKLQRQLARHGRRSSATALSSMDSVKAQSKPESQPKSTNEEEASDLDRVMVTGSMIMPEDIITNVQTSGIDEGGIFKRRGDHLLVLRGDRLSRIRIDGPDGPTLQLEQSISLSDPDLESGVWFDELIVFDDGAVVLSFDYDRALTSLQFFHMGPVGTLERAAHIEIQSQDYYTGSNYGMRLIGDRLLFQVSVPLSVEHKWQWPMWRSGGLSAIRAEPTSWRPLIEAEDVLMPLTPVSDPVIHAVFMCDLDDLKLERMDCDPTGLVSESWTELYVSQTAAYVAMEAWQERAYVMDDFSPWSWRARQNPEFSNLIETLIYRLPLDNDKEPGAIFLPGEQGNQFSFREVGNELIVVNEVHTSSEGRRLAIHRVLTSEFSDRLEAARTPRIDTQELNVNHRHRTIRVADGHVVVGEHGMMYSDEHEPIKATELIIVPLEDGREKRLLVSQSVDRVEPVGDRFFISGIDASGRWSMALVNPRARVFTESLAVDSHNNAESRSHAFNWREVSDGDVIMGLPGAPDTAHKSNHYWQDRTSVSDFIFLISDGNSLNLAGVLDMQQSLAPGDECHEDLSCSDWYGNARLAFIGNRIFALSGNQLTESQLANREIQQVRYVRLD